MPIPKHAEANEARLLDFHLLGGVGAANSAKLASADFFPGLALGLLYFVFNGQAVAVPTRHIGRIKAAHLAGLYYDVFQGLVDGVAKVQVTIGIRWAIVQNELGFASVLGADFAVEIHALPLFQHARLLLRQPGFHRKVGMGQVQAVFVIAHGGDIVLYFA